MQARFATAVLLGFVLVAAAACSGGGDGAKIAELEAAIEANKDALEKADDDAAAAKKKSDDDAAAAKKKSDDDAAAAKKKADDDAAAAKKKADDDAAAAEQEADDDAAAAEQEADEKIQQQASTLVANQRAEKLLAALPDTVTAVSSTSRVFISVPSANKLTFKQSDYTVRTISAPGLRGARLTRTRGGTQKSVVYTDIELSRSLIKNYDPDADATTLTFPLADVPEGARADFLRDEDAVEITSHGFRSSRRYEADGTTLKTDADDNELDPLTKMGSSFTGKVHGISGTFQCSTSCTLTASYSSDNKLETLTISDVADVTFKPGSLTATTASTAAVSLCAAPRSRCAVTDSDYMAFGYWRSEPSNAQGDYEFELFAFGPTLISTGPTGSTAEYNGTAVGMYVEQNQVGTAEVTKKQGEFIADARLDYDGSDLSGTIDSFKTTPTGGSGAPSTTGWVVELNGDESTTLDRHGPDGVGNWTHKFTTDGSAVVGTFESELEEVLHIVGAFGARQ